MDTKSVFLEARSGSYKCDGKYFSANTHKRGIEMTELFLQAFVSVRSLHSTLLHRARSEQGASMVEYALLVGLIAIVAVAAITLLGGAIANLFGGAGNTLNNLPAS